VASYIITSPDSVPTAILLLGKRLLLSVYKLAYSTNLPSSSAPAKSIDVAGSLSLIVCQASHLLPSRFAGFHILTYGSRQRLQKTLRASSPFYHELRLQKCLPREPKRSPISLSSETCRYKGGCILHWYHQLKFGSIKREGAAPPSSLRVKSLHERSRDTVSIIRSSGLNDIRVTVRV
jgi:hypothetical protein